MNDLPQLVTILQAGGTPALVIAVYYLAKVENRLSRLEKALDIFTRGMNNGRD
jgi:hypothetical protein